MEGFNYTNIFETKGIEYIGVIAFLILLIPFWIILNKKEALVKSIKKALSVFSFDNLKLPQGIFYGKNHTWAFMEKSGTASVGIDDFLLHTIGEVKLNYTKGSGETINKGDLLIELVKDDKVLKIFSPISGIIEYSNSNLIESPELLNNDPYGQGWIYKIKPAKWKEETRMYYLAEEATNWSKKEIERLKDFMAESGKNYLPQPSLVVMQDGGELLDHTLSMFPEKVWLDFQESFLNEKS